MNRYKVIKDEQKKINKEVMKDILVLSSALSKKDKSNICLKIMDILSKNALLSCYTIVSLEELEKKSIDELTKIAENINVIKGQFIKRLEENKYYCYTYVGLYLRLYKNIKDKTTDEKLTKIKSFLKTNNEVVNKFSTKGLTEYGYEMIMDEFINDTEKEKVRETSLYLYRQNIEPLVKDLIDTEKKVNNY